MPRKNLIAGNWKMNNTIPEAVVLAQEISNRMERDWLELVDVAVCPPFVDLKPVKSVFEFDRVDIAVGAQNVYWEPKGAFTGEISIAMIKNIGCAFCIVGHSERRNLFGETNEEVNLKARALIEADITPIICVGESLSVRDGGTYLDFVTAQVRAAYAGMDAADAARTVVAYEPVWAIGTGRTATPEQAEAAMRRWMELYPVIGNKLTKPYPHMEETLAALTQRGIGLGDLSNKFDQGVHDVIDAYLPGLFPVQYGECDEIPRKPDPTGLLRCIDELGSAPARTAYVGDSPGDVLVSRNAGAFAIGVSWGYHHADALRKAGADVVIEDARELLQFAVER